ncbi:MAG: IS1595 family transposase [Crocinitomicaceae bacterium]|nr:IS1595 family transposase [Crocinitomicaceae bacterium]|tara:strand:- start:7004 stop:7921 length:918 start_codon:yes stop_codon:yes gene_type:complete
MIGKEFSSIVDLIKVFPNERVCMRYLERMRWGSNIVSPFDSSSKVYKCKNHRFKCKNTGKYFNAKTKTLFDCTKIELQKWFVAIWLTTSHKKGISSAQLARDIKVTQKTAWFMLQRIRNCFGLDESTELAGDIEVDETYVGGKNKNRHRDKKFKYSQGRSYKDKTPVFGMVQRDGKLLAKVVPNVKSITLQTIIYDHVKLGSVMHTDEWLAYRGLNQHYDHRVVEHGKGIYGTEDSTTNTIEGAWSILKRMIIGIYHSTSRKHLQLYVDEFVFRYNSRLASESGRFNLFLNNIEHRLTYKGLVYG